MTEKITAPLLFSSDMPRLCLFQPTTSVDGQTGGESKVSIPSSLYRKNVEAAATLASPDPVVHTHIVGVTVFHQLVI